MGVAARALGERIAENSVPAVGESTVVDSKESLGPMYLFKFLIDLSIKKIEMVLQRNMWCDKIVLLLL